MNVVFLSPAFPPTAERFCYALRDRGVNVLGIGDEPLSSQGGVGSALTTYVFEPQMADYDVLRGAVSQLRERYGAIARIDSNGEHWLDAEARLRDDFDVPGLRVAELRRHRSKLGMAETFAAAGIACPAGIRADSAQAVRLFAERHGFPLVLKPDSGSGAAHTFTVANAAELEQSLQTDLRGHIVQPFLEGDIVTFDGLTNSSGDIVFSTSHVYDVGIMQVRRGRLDGHYYSLRVVPPALELLGARAVKAFDLRERFFHLECFVRPDGSYVALEMNVRPPGGFSTDMMNYAGDIDVYTLWARALTGEALSDFTYERSYHTAHAGRRSDRRYRVGHDELVEALGPSLVAVRPVPPAFADTMGDTAYLLRDADLDSLRSAIQLIQAP